jgi:cytochrome c biogenesis protein CcmG, thiol:disulfide interchange protein DsbE
MRSGLRVAHLLALSGLLGGCSAELAPASAVVPAPSATSSAAPLPSTPAAPVTSAAPSAAPRSRASRPGAVAGKVTLVHFWATWCAPCLKSFPAYQALYATYRARGFDIAAFSEDEDRTPVADFVRSTGVTFPVTWDADHAAVAAWKAATMPATYLLDRHGALRFTHLGYAAGDEVVVDKEIQALLAEP